MPLPAPPEPQALEPLISVWSAGRPLVRIHHRRFGPTSFNPNGGRGRFHPFPGADGLPVPTLYAADSLDGALSETAFRAVPVRGPARRLAASRLTSLRLSVLRPDRDLRLAALHGHGLRRLGVTREELIGTESADYPATVAWAAALHAAPIGLDGLEWVSRQHDTSRAVVLFGDRIEPGALDPRRGPIELDRGPGWEAVLRAAEQAGILIVL